MNRFKVALISIFRPKLFGELFVGNNNNKTKEGLGMLAEYNWHKEQAFKKWASSDFEGYHNDPVTVCVEYKHCWREAAAYCEANNLTVTRAIK